MLKHDGITGMGAAIFYGVTSTSMAFLNKAVINSYEFNFPFFILACQMLITIIFIELLHKLNKISLPHYTWKSAKSFLVPSFSYATHAALSLMALEGMNIPMYTAIKRCSPLVNLVLSVVILKRAMPSCLLTSSIFVITGGCIIAVMGDATFEKFSYTVGVMSVFAQGIYLTLVQKFSENQLSTIEILQLNSYNTLAPFIIISLISGEPKGIVTNTYVADMGFHLVFFTLISLGAVLNYSLFLCTALTSALTTSLVAVAKSVIQTLVGFFVFGGITFNPLNVTGILLNMIGGFIYTYIKYKEQSRKKSRDQHLEENSKNSADVGERLINITTLNETKSS